LREKIIYSNHDSNEIKIIKNINFTDTINTINNNNNYMIKIRKLLHIIDHKTIIKYKNIISSTLKYFNTDDEFTKICEMYKINKNIDSNNNLNKLIKNIKKEYPYMFNTNIKKYIMLKHYHDVDDIYFNPKSFKLPVFYDNYNLICFNMIEKLNNNPNTTDKEFVKFIFNTIKIFNDGTNLIYYVKEFTQNNHMIYKCMNEYELNDLNIKFKKNEKIHNISLLELINKYSKCITYDNVEYIPYNNINDFKNIYDKNILNLFTGFITRSYYFNNITKIEKILNHIKIVLCFNSIDHCDYFLNWLSQIIQYPLIKTGIAILMIGNDSKYIKAPIYKFLKKYIFGDQNVTSTNEIPNENSVKDCLLTSCDIKNSSCDNLKLHEYITSNTMKFKDKNINIYSNFIISTNIHRANEITHSKKIFMCLDVSKNIVDEFLFDSNYETGNYFYNYLLQRNINNWNPKVFPINSALNNFKLNIIPKAILFMINILNDEFVPSDELKTKLSELKIEFKLPNRISSKNIFELYNMWREYHAKLNTLKSSRYDFNKHVEEINMQSRNIHIGNKSFRGYYIEPSEIMSSIKRVYGLQ
jgi:hypothetical protein